MPTVSNNTLIHEVVESEVRQYRITPSGVRELVFASMIVGAGLKDSKLSYAPGQQEVEDICDMALEAVKAGRLIDFGFIPNAVIQDCGGRGGPMYQQGAFAQPFREPWMMFHEWSLTGESTVAASCYLINPLEDHCDTGADFEAVGLEPCIVNGTQKVLLIADRVAIQTDGNDPSMYGCHVAPAMHRFVNPETNGGQTPQAAAASNVLDPIMTGLMMLATSGVARETVRAGDKLNKARIKNQKPPIPPYDRVHSEGYVTAIMARRFRRKRGADQGGTHASPVPHLRQGHFRHYADGKRSLIHDTLVRVTPEARAAFLAQRSHYQVR